MHFGLKLFFFGFVLVSARDFWFQLVFFGLKLVSDWYFLVSDWYFWFQQCFFGFSLDMFGFVLVSDWFFWFGVSSAASAKFKHAKYAFCHETHATLQSSSEQVVLLTSFWQRAKQYVSEWPSKHPATHASTPKPKALVQVCCNGQNSKPSLKNLVPGQVQHYAS